MADIVYIVLYTHQKTKKAKTWQDGTLKLLATGTKAVLYDDKGGKLDALHVHASDVVSGEQLESDRYFIQVEECLQKSCSQPPAIPVCRSTPSPSLSQPSQHAIDPAKADHPQAFAASAAQSLGGRGGPGLKRKRSGFIPPRIVRPRKADEDANLLGNSFHGNHNLAMPSTVPTVPAWVEKQPNDVHREIPYIGGVAEQRVDLGLTSTTRSFSSSRMFSNSHPISPQVPGAFCDSSSSYCSGTSANTLTKTENGFGVREDFEEKSDTSFRSPGFAASRLTSVMKNSPWRTIGAKSSPVLLSPSATEEAVERPGREVHSGREVNLVKSQVNCGARNLAERSSPDIPSRPTYCTQEKMTVEQKQFPENFVLSGTSKSLVKRSTSEIMALIGKNKTGASSSETCKEQDIFSECTVQTCVSQSSNTSANTSLKTAAENGEHTPYPQSNMSLPLPSRISSPGNKMSNSSMNVDSERAGSKILNGSMAADLEKSIFDGKSTSWAELNLSNSEIKKINAEHEETSSKHFGNSIVEKGALSVFGLSSESSCPALVTSKSQCSEVSSNTVFRKQLSPCGTVVEDHPAGEWKAPKQCVGGSQGLSILHHTADSNTSLQSPALPSYTLKSYTGKLTGDDKRSDESLQECYVVDDSLNISKTNSSRNSLSHPSFHASAHNEMVVTAPGDASSTERSHDDTIDGKESEKSSQESPSVGNPMPKINKSCLSRTGSSFSSCSVSPNAKLAVSPDMKLEVSPQLSASTLSLCKHDFEEHDEGDFDEGLSNASVYLSRTSADVVNSQSLSDFDLPKSQHDAEQQVSHYTSVEGNFIYINYQQSEVTKPTTSTVVQCVDAQNCIKEKLPSLEDAENKIIEGRELNLRPDETNSTAQQTSNMQLNTVNTAEEESRVTEDNVEVDFEGCFEMSFSPLTGEDGSDGELVDSENNKETLHTNSQFDSQDMPFVGSAPKQQSACIVTSPSQCETVLDLGKNNINCSYADIAEHTSVLSYDTDDKKTRSVHVKGQILQTVKVTSVTDLCATSTVDSEGQEHRQQNADDLQILQVTQGQRALVCKDVMDTARTTNNEKEVGKLPEKMVNFEITGSESKEGADRPPAQRDPQPLNTEGINCGHPLSNSAHTSLCGSNSQYGGLCMRTLDDLDISPDTVAHSWPSHQPPFPESQLSYSSCCERPETEEDIWSCNSSQNPVNLQEPIGMSHCKNVGEQELLQDCNDTDSFLVPPKLYKTDSVTGCSRHVLKSPDILQSGLLSTSPKAQLPQDNSLAFSNGSGAMDIFSLSSSSNYSDVTSQDSIHLPTGFKRIAVLAEENAGQTKVPRLNKDHSGFVKQGSILTSHQVEANNSDVALDNNGRPPHLTTGDDCRHHSPLTLPVYRVFQTVSEALGGLTRQAARGANGHMANETSHAARETTRHAARKSDDEDPGTDEWRKEMRENVLLPRRAEDIQLHQCATESALGDGYHGYQTASASLPRPDQLIRASGAVLTEGHLAKPVDVTQAISACLTGYRMQGMVSGDMVQRGVFSRPSPGMEQNELDPWNKLSFVPVGRGTERNNQHSVLCGEAMPPACGGDKRRQLQARHVAGTPEACLFSPEGEVMGSTDGSFFVDWQQGKPGLDSPLLKNQHTKQLPVSPKEALQRVPEFPDAVAMLKMCQVQRHPSRHTPSDHSCIQLQDVMLLRQSPTQSEFQPIQRLSEDLKHHLDECGLSKHKHKHSSGNEANPYEAEVSEEFVREGDLLEETGDVISVSSDSQTSDSRLQEKGRYVTQNGLSNIDFVTCQVNLDHNAASAVITDSINEVSSTNPSKNSSKVSTEYMLDVLKEGCIKRTSLSQENTSSLQNPPPLSDPPIGCVRVKPALKGRILKPVITEPDVMPQHSEVELPNVGTDRITCTALSLPSTGLTAETAVTVGGETRVCDSMCRSSGKQDSCVLQTSVSKLPFSHHHQAHLVDNLENPDAGDVIMETEQNDIEGFEDSFQESDYMMEQQLLAAEQAVTTMSTQGDTTAATPLRTSMQDRDVDSCVAGLVQGAADRPAEIEKTAVFEKDKEVFAILQSKFTNRRGEPAAMPSSLLLGEGPTDGLAMIKSKSTENNSSKCIGLSLDCVITDNAFDCVDEEDKVEEAAKRHSLGPEDCRKNSLPQHPAWSKARRLASQLQELNPGFHSKETHSRIRSQDSLKLFISHKPSQSMPDMGDLLAPSSPTGSPPLDISPLRSSPTSSLLHAKPYGDDSAQGMFTHQPFQSAFSITGSSQAAISHTKQETLCISSLKETHKSNIGSAGFQNCTQSSGLGDMVVTFPHDSGDASSLSSSLCEDGAKGSSLRGACQDKGGVKRPFSRGSVPTARKVGLGKFHKPESSTQSVSRLCGELQFCGQEEVRLQATPERQMSIPASFASVMSYRNILTAAITEFLNLQLFEVAKCYHCALCQIDVSGYIEGVCFQGKVAAESSNPPCRCRQPSKVAQVKKEGPNKGRFFYTCPEPRAKQCKFFQWVDQHSAKNSGISKSGPISAKPRFTDPDSIMGYFRSHKVALYCQCQFVRRVDCRSDNRFRAWVRSQQTDSMQKKSVYIKLFKKVAARMHAKDDLWMVSRSLSFERGETLVARSTFHGPNSNAEVAIEPLAGYSTSQWTDGDVCHAIHCGNAATELSCMANLQDHVDLNSLPVLPHLLDRQCSVTGSVRSTGKGFKSPQVTQGPSKLHIPPHLLHDLAEDFASRYQLNADQTTALREAANMMNRDAHPVTSLLLIHGVFGAGKSFLLSVLILFLVEVFQHNDTYSPGVPFPWKLLLSSTTNVAVDRVLLGLLSLGFEDFVRVGSVKKIARPVLPYSVHAGGSESQELRDLQEMLKSADITPSEKHFVRKSIEKQRLGENRKRLGAVRVVGVTCAASSFQCLYKMNFPFVVLDECSQMTEPSSLLPIARFACHKLVLVGDPKQLDPTLQGSSAAHRQGLEQTLFDRLMRMGHHPVILRTQYRCHPTISAVANTLFYQGQLIDGITAKDRAPVVDLFPPICFYDVSMGQDQTDASGSFVNEAEAQFVVLLLAAMMAREVGAGSVGVISLYKAQAHHIMDIIKAHCRDDELQSQMTAVQVSTVDAFQGGERDIIILTCVRTGHLGFIDCDKRMNVALTRGRHHLLIVGHQRNLCGNRRWAQVIGHCQGIQGGIMASTTASKQLQAVVDQARDGNHDKSDTDLSTLHNAQSVKNSQPPVDPTSCLQLADADNSPCPLHSQGSPSGDQPQADCDNIDLATEPSPVVTKARSRLRVKPLVVEDSEDEGTSSDSSLPDGL